MIATDFLPPTWRRPGITSWSVIALAVLSWLVSINPPASILDFLNRTAFPGYAILAPVAFIALYAPSTGSMPAAIALVAGVVLVITESAGLVTPPVPSALFNLAIQSVILGTALLIRKRRLPDPHAVPGVQLALPKPRTALIMLMVMCVLGVDVWNYLPWASHAVLPGLPLWVVYHTVLTLCLGLAYFVVSGIRKADKLEQ